MFRNDIPALNILRKAPKLMSTQKRQRRTLLTDAILNPYLCIMPPQLFRKLVPLLEFCFDRSRGAPENMQGGILSWMTITKFHLAIQVQGGTKMCRHPRMLVENTPKSASARERLCVLLHIQHASSHSQRMWYRKLILVRHVPACSLLCVYTSLKHTITIDGCNMCGTCLDIL